jgi:hypothetical protein
MTDTDKPVAIIRTSDRTLFKRCRRKWDWQSHLRQKLHTTTANPHFWLGSGIHFALEDFHGYQHYSSMKDAFDAYVDARRRTQRDPLPDNWKEQEELGQGMCEYYMTWLSSRDPLRTYWQDGEPEMEQIYRIELPNPYPDIYEAVYYTVEFDRVVIDENGRLWLVEYKTHGKFQTFHFQTDEQVSANCWAAEYLYGKPIAGMIYQQHKKTLPEPPRILSNGKISHNKNQNTTYLMYKRALENLYGSVGKAPMQNKDVLNLLASTEDENSDRFIRRDFIERSSVENVSTEEKILLEVREMLNPDVGIYPTPNWTCENYCEMQVPCISFDDGSDWKQQLEAVTIPSATAREEQKPWRAQLQLP